MILPNFLIDFGTVAVVSYCALCNYRCVLGNDVDTESVKYLLKGVPKNVSETKIRSALRQKKYSPLWVLLQFMDSTTALVALRVPKKSKYLDFSLSIKRRSVDAVKLTDVEEAEFELMLSSATMEMLSSAESLKMKVDSMIKRMLEVQSRDLFLGKKHDIKYDLVAATSSDYEVHPFGSRVTGLGLGSSDYDVFIDMGNYYRGGGETKIQNSVQGIRDMLRYDKAFRTILMIPRARVPVLKVQHVKTGVQCDISTTNGLGVENTKLLRRYLEDKRVRFVCTAVKVWAHRMGLTQSAMGPGALTSYCLIWLVLYALMQDSPPAVVSVFQAKQAYQGERLFIDGWDCSFCDTPLPKTKNNKNEFELLHHFFNVFSSMTARDFINNVVCPYTGTLIPVRDFVKTKQLPSEFANYKKQVGRNKWYEMSCGASLMYVQDPVEQNHNIAKAVDSWVLDRFLKLCRTSAQIMEHSMADQLQYISSSIAEAA